MVTRNILITPAPDCPSPQASPPPLRAKPSRANIEFDILKNAPYVIDHKTFSYQVHVQMAAISGKPPLTFDAFHQKGQPCMRASPLTKRLGWAAHYDRDGRLALIDPQGPAFTVLAADPELPQRAALRNRRA